MVRYTWWIWARKDQILPEGDWLKLVACCGRMWGKTRFGAQSVVEHAMANPGTIIALIGRTKDSVRKIMIENPKSGILAVSPPWFKPDYHKTDGEVHFPNGSKAYVFSSQDPEPIRGNEFSFAWCDELCAWQYLQETWTILIPCMRLGKQPHIVVTTTPKNQKIIKELLADPDVIKVRGGTQDNIANLPRHVVRAIYSEWKGTRLEAQELKGEILEDIDGTYWTSAQIEALRRPREDVFGEKRKVTIVKTVVGVDPAITSSSWSDITGIVVVGLGDDGHLYVLGDYSTGGRPEAWNEAIFKAIEDHGASCVVVETNRGGECIEALLRAYAQLHGKYLPRVEDLNSQEGKAGRAEPVSAKYEQGRVHHVGVFGELEDEQTSWVPFPKSDAGEIQPKQKSPNRIDALVFACVELIPNMPVWEGVADVVEPEPSDSPIADKIREWEEEERRPLSRRRSRR